MNIVAHNLSAMNAQRMFGINTKNKAKSTEKLSSGYKVNRAADDAAGLAISEKMRRQIRGLKQGADNIQDGVSMVQVAEGALGEITECVQRINELSIKAYNGTNQKQDREYIQSEVNQLITEIQRIADTTTFNEIPLLKGNPAQKVPAEPGMGYEIKDYPTQVPAWLQVSESLSVDNSIALEQAGYTQDRGFEASFQTSPGVYETYGPNGDMAHQWTESLSDNASAIIDFSGLANVTSGSELYNNLFQLIGTSIGVPCGTCTEYYGISFTGSERGLEVKDGAIKFSNGSAASGSYVNLSEWKPYAGETPQEHPDWGDMNVFEVVKDLMREHAMDDSMPDDIKLAKVQELAAYIAQGLCKKSYDEISKTVNGAEHFDKLLQGSLDGPVDGTKIVIYDFRDTDKLSNVDAADSLVQTSAQAKALVPYELLDERQYVEVKKPLIIQCSSQTNDKIPVDLPLIDNEALGIAEYNIAFYREKVVYSSEYQQRLEDWERNGRHFETITETIPGTPATTQMVKRPYLDYDRNGEEIFSWRDEQITIPAVPERTITKTILVEDIPKPEPGPGDVTIEYTYEPDDVKLISDALAYISKCRSDLGATQNRLEHAYNSNRNNEENTTASESRIRDTDMAKEMVRYSNISILEQVGQAMMAQANQSNQGVLSLLG